MTALAQAGIATIGKALAAALAQGTLPQATLAKGDRDALGSLTDGQRRTIRTMLGSHATLTLGTREKDGSILASGLAHQHIGRTRKAAGLPTGLTLWPRIKDGAYWRPITYRIHPDGRRCGFERGNCGSPACKALEAAHRPTAAQHKATRAAIAATGGSALMPSTLPGHSQPARKGSGTATKATKATTGRTRKQPARKPQSPAEGTRGSGKGSTKGTPRKRSTGATKGSQPA